MWAGGSYVLLRLEKDVLVRTGCLPGLGTEYDQLVVDERRSHPELLTGQSNLTRPPKTRWLLRALGAPRSARVYRAGGEPLGGEQALRPLMAKFPKLTSKVTLASDGELVQFANKSSVLAAVDFIVAMSSDVFMPSHGGNMARLIQGHRVYLGHKKSITPNKRAVFQLLKQAAAAEKSEGEVRSMMKRVHAQRMGQPEERGRKKGRDVIAFPVPECMCRRRLLRFLF
ncbi:putative O-fucosyltransferase 37 [Cocos nucifera]|nr:putative O-fucosyltransferase 37 [Cocos nucifera]